MYDAILFDLDGTLLGLDNDHFVNLYFKALGQKLSPWYPEGEIIPLIVQATEAMMKAREYDEQLALQQMQQQQQ